MSQSIAQGFVHFAPEARHNLHAVLVLAIGLSCAATQAQAQTGERSGKDIVDSLCISCHGRGAGGAPKIGDKDAWTKRASKGLTGLSKSALEGIRQMPPHGGNMKLTDTEIERAITYMVNQSGGHWNEPVSRKAAARERTGQEVVNARCIECHGEGKNGAPKIGDKAAWIPRMKQGFDVVVRSAINGHGAMPPRGGMANLTDREIRAAITYMFQASGAPVTSAR
jgi:cytochrome c5